MLIKHHTQNIADKTFLITGGAGFIGSNLVEYLLFHKAKKVRVLDNFSTGSKKNIANFLANPAFELIEGDIRNLETCQNAMKGIGYVSHQAALGSVPRSIKNPIQSNEVNIDGFLNMLVAAKEAEIKHFVFAASSSSQGNASNGSNGKPLSPYAVTKLVNELYADVFEKVYGFHSIGLRYYNVFGPKQNPNGAYAAVIPLFIQHALKNEPPFINGDGLTSRDFTYIENVVQANIKALLTNANSSSTVNVALGNSTTLNALWKHIAEETKCAAKPIYREERRGDIKHSLANIEQAIKLFNYAPQVKVGEGISKTISWYKENNDF